MKTDMLVKRIYPKVILDKYIAKKNMMGQNGKINIYFYLNVKLILIFLLFIMLLLFLKHGYILAPLLSLVFYFLLDYIYLDSKIKKRSKVLEKEAIFFFEVLILTIQSEKNLQTCLKITTDAIDSNLSLEFKYLLKEVRLGKTLNEALLDLKKSIPSKNVTKIILSLIEANSYGNSITDTLENQIEYLTDKRILEIKGQINKLPTKISIVSVLIIVPLILLLILGPVLINYLFN